MRENYAKIVDGKDYTKTLFLYTVIIMPAGQAATVRTFLSESKARDIYDAARSEYSYDLVHNYIDIIESELE